jgi:hypothetical protein
MEMGLLERLSMISLRIREPEQALLQEIIVLVPENE